MMLDLENPRAIYVLAAYGLVAAGLFGLLLASWCASRRSRKEWADLEGRNRKNPQ